MSLTELLLRLKPAPSPTVFIKDKASYRVPELTGIHYCKPIEIANILQHTADALINDPNSSLNPRYMMREILLMDEMYRLFEDLPEGEYIESDQQIKLSREENGITVTYEDPDKDPHENQKRKISVRWFKSEPKTERFTHCHVLDQFMTDGKLVRSVVTGYEEFGNTIGNVRGFNYCTEMIEMSESLESSSVDKRIRYHKGRYSHDGTPLSVSQS